MRWSKRVIVTLLLAPITAWAIEHDHGPGAVFSIAEEDALEEIKERGKDLDMESYFNGYPREGWSVWKGHALPRVEKSIKRSHIPWYTLEFDIPGPNGQTLYPKGFTFNPLQYTQLPTRIVVFKLDQYEHIKKYLNPQDMLIADAGDVVEAAEKIGRHIFILNSQLVERLGIQRAPSVIRQRGARFEITEIKVDE